MPSRHYLYCEPCKKVRQVSPEPACIHFGKRSLQHNSESSMVVFRFADGRTSIPWSPDAKLPRGAVREEIRGAKAVRKLERELDAKDLSKHRHYQEKLERMMEPINASMRAGLHRQMSNATTQFERDYVRGVLDRLDRQPASSGYEAGNHRD